MRISLCQISPDYNTMRQRPWARAWRTLALRGGQGQEQLVTLDLRGLDDASVVHVFVTGEGTEGRRRDERG